MTSVYTTALAVGLTSASVLTVPLAEHFGSWRWGLFAWAMTAGLAALPWLGLLRHDAGIKQHPHREEEQHGKGIAQRQGFLRRALRQLRTRQDHAANQEQDDRDGGPLHAVVVITHLVTHEVGIISEVTHKDLLLTNLLNCPIKPAVAAFRSALRYVLRINDVCAGQGRAGAPPHGR